MTRFLWRLTGAMVLNPAVYEDVEADKSATMQAAGVVLCSSLAAGVGLYGFRGDHLIEIAIVSLVALVLWTVWALLTYQIGSWWLPSLQTYATPGELLRTIGFASAPGIFRLAAIMPGLRGATFAVTALWMLAAMVVAVRQALDFSSTARAMAVCGIGWTLALGLALIIGFVFGPVAH
jgi:hypothetical protein